MDVHIRQGDSLTIIIDDDENPIAGEITIEYRETYFAIKGYVNGPDRKTENIDGYVKR